MRKSEPDNYSEYYRSGNCILIECLLLVNYILYNKIIIVNYILCSKTMYSLRSAF